MDDRPWDADQVAEAAASLSSHIHANEALRRDVGAILDQYVGRAAPTVETLENVFSALALYVDEDFAGFLLGHLGNADQDPQLMTDYEARLDPATRLYLRRLLALYGSRVTEAIAIDAQEPEGWRTIEREIYFDLFTESWFVRMAIRTYGGGSYPLKETPGSALGLASGILDTVLKAVDSAGSSVVDPEQVRSLFELADELNSSVIAEDDEV